MPSFLERRKQEKEMLTKNIRRVIDSWSPEQGSFPIEVQTVKNLTWNKKGYKNV